ncbi:MAG: hypothetical protein EHM28_03595 [Spirochaetaceae bacterium]|nr:MAG: hypothetical protein EHM28_03595 [Spirochaetaceae bacterium]
MGEPVLVGLLFADRIITEDNGKKGIIGTFNRFQSEKYPVVFPTWGIYAAVTNLTGSHEFAVNLVADGTGQVIIPIAGHFDVTAVTDVVELTPTIVGAVFPSSGKYTMTFHIDGNIIGARTLFVEQGEQSSRPGKAPGKK